MSYGSMRKDTSEKPIPVIAWKRVDTTISGTPWVITQDDRVIMPTTTVNVILTTTGGVAQESVEIPAHLPIGLIDGFTYTFDAAIQIMVM